MTAADVFYTKEEWLRRIAFEVGLNRAEHNRYVAFMQRRFPHEIYKSYAAEWAERFKTGRPEDFCDKESLKALSWVTSGVEA